MPIEVVNAAPGRQLPGAYPDHGKQFDQVALLQKLGLTQAEFVFFCEMVRSQLIKAHGGKDSK